MNDTTVEILLIDTVRFATAFEYGAICTLTLTVFDICIFFSDEVEIIWNTRWSWGKALYIWIRYGALCYQIALFCSALLIGPSASFCQGVLRAQTWIAITTTFAEIGAISLRTAAVFGSSYRVKKMIYIACGLQLCVLAGSTTAMSVLAHSIPRPFKDASCQLTQFLPRVYIIISDGTSLAFELLLLFSGSILVFRMVADGQSKLAWMIVRDTLVYIPMIIALAIPQFFGFLFVFNERSLILSILSGASVAIQSIMVSRMIFNLREYVAGPPDLSLRTMATVITPTVAMASTMVFEEGETETYD